EHRAARQHSNESPANRNYGRRQRRSEQTASSEGLPDQAGEANGQDRSKRGTYQIASFRHVKTPFRVQRSERVLSEFEGSRSLAGLGTNLEPGTLNLELSIIPASSPSEQLSSARSSGKPVFPAAGR